MQQIFYNTYQKKWTEFQHSFSASITLWMSPCCVSFLTRGFSSLLFSVNAEQVSSQCFRSTWREELLHLTRIVTCTITYICWREDIIFLSMYTFQLPMTTCITVESRSIVFQGDGENKRWMRTNDQSGKLLHIVNTWCVQVLRSPNLFKKNNSSQEAENAVISQRNHPVDVHIFHNAHATIAWPQQTLL